MKKEKEGVTGVKEFVTETIEKFKSFPRELKLAVLREIQFKVGQPLTEEELEKLKDLSIDLENTIKELNKLLGKYKFLSEKGLYLYELWKDIQRAKSKLESVQNRILDIVREIYLKS